MFSISSRSKYKLREVLSYMPDRVINYLVRHWKLAYDPADGWTFWLDVSYAKWCRKDLKKGA